MIEFKEHGPGCWLSEKYDGRLRGIEADMTDPQAEIRSVRLVEADLRIAIETSGKVRWVLGVEWGDSPDSVRQRVKELEGTGA